VLDGILNGGSTAHLAPSAQEESAFVAEANAGILRVFERRGDVWRILGRKPREQFGQPLRALQWIGDEQGVFPILRERGGIMTIGRG
jgi:hypothetical protein